MCISSSNRKMVNLLNLIRNTELSHLAWAYSVRLKEYGTKHMVENGLFHEFLITLKKTNKVFCSEWLSEQQIVLGTKCNKLLIFDVISQNIINIPTLQGSDNSVPLENPCGIHAVATNPSKTMLVTGGQQSNDVAVYHLPTFDPICVGEGAHKDWIFDIKWLDDEFFVTGSRDNTLALWHVTEMKHNLPDYQCPYYLSMKPVIVKTCNQAEKVRALIFNPKYDLVALTLNAYIHLWDMATFQQKLSIKLPYCQENVCLAYHTENKVYAVGSRSHITLLESSSLKTVKTIKARYEGCGIRSLSFKGHLLTVGTGVGALLFYDIRTGKYLEQAGRSALLRATNGLIYPDNVFHEVFPHLEYCPALYTHCYDSSGTRLFAAGGPLPSGLQGNYAALWQ